MIKNILYSLFLHLLLLALIYSNFNLKTNTTKNDSNEILVSLITQDLNNSQKNDKNLEKPTETKTEVYKNEKLSEKPAKAEVSQPKDPKAITKKSPVVEKKAKESTKEFKDEKTLLKEIDKIITDEDVAVNNNQKKNSKKGKRP